MIDLRTKEMTRREIVKGGLGLAAILAAGKAPAMLLGARGMAMGGGKKKPYDFAYSYIPMSNGPYINLGLSPAGTNYFRFKTKLAAKSDTSDRNIIGAQVGSMYLNTAVSINFWNNKVQTAGYGVKLAEPPNVNQLSDIEVIYSSNVSKISFGGVDYGVSSGSFVESECDLPLYLFASNMNGSAGRLFRGIVYSPIELSVGNVNARFIPVSKDGVISYYDEIGGLFYDAIGGSFNEGKIDGSDDELTFGYALQSSNIVYSSEHCYCETYIPIGTCQKITYRWADSGASSCSVIEYGASYNYIDQRSATASTGIRENLPIQSSNTRYLRFSCVSKYWRNAFLFDVTNNRYLFKDGKVCV